MPHHALGRRNASTVAPQASGSRELTWSTQNYRGDGDRCSDCCRRLTTEEKPDEPNYRSAFQQKPNPLRSSQRSLRVPVGFLAVTSLKLRHAWSEDEQSDG